MLVVVTSDHGMPFPFVKGQIHEDGFPPLAMLGRRHQARSPSKISSTSATRPDVWKSPSEAPRQMTGKASPASFAAHSGFIENRDFTLAGRAPRSRPPNDPVIPSGPSDQRLPYVHNFHPERWPAGNPEWTWQLDPGPQRSRQAPRRSLLRAAFGKRLSDELIASPTILNASATWPTTSLSKTSEELRTNS